MAEPITTCLVEGCEAQCEAFYNTCTAHRETHCFECGIKAHYAGLCEDCLRGGDEDWDEDDDEDEDNWDDGEEEHDDIFVEELTCERDALELRVKELEAVLLECQSDLASIVGLSPTLGLNAGVVERLQSTLNLTIAVLH